MEQELEMAQVYMESKNYESSFNILHPLGKFWRIKFLISMGCLLANIYLKTIWKLAKKLTQMMKKDFELKSRLFLT